MDDKRFDLLTRAFASSANRRSLIKGLLGLGGAAAIGTAVDESAEAARRGTTTPPPPKCTTPQTWDPVTKTCKCPSGLTQCVPEGPTCCNDQVPVGVGYSECCDNACCHFPNQCVAEEHCCPRLPDVGCLDEDGHCCTTLCEETLLGVECCPDSDFCPGGSESPDLCCAGNTTCCDGGTNNNACIDLLSRSNACCGDDDCTAVDNCTPADCLESHQCNTVSSCKTGETCCGDGPEDCKNLQTDNNNCGECGNVCPGCSTCQGGVCTANDDKCSGDQICCPGPGEDTFHCEAGPNCGCDGPDDCGDCQHCDGGDCIDNCSRTETCCTKGPEDDCCTSSETCLDNIGCCAKTDVCGAECCDSDTETCCTDENGVSRCIPTGNCCRNDQCSGLDDPQHCKDGVCLKGVGEFDGTCQADLTCDDLNTKCCPGADADDPGACVAKTATCCTPAVGCAGECQICDPRTNTCIVDTNCCPGGCGDCGKCVAGKCEADSSIDCGSNCAVCNQEENGKYYCDDCPDNTTCCGDGPEGCKNLQTDNNNCGECGHVCPGCSSCQQGVCKPDDDNCDGNEGKDICCPSGTGFSCQTGPHCGCDVDGDCEGLTDLTQCKVGVCRQSGDIWACTTEAAPSGTICHQAGENPICDPEATCSGTDQSCPGPDYAPSGTDCGDCATCNATGICIDNCPSGLCCDDDFCADSAGECCGDDNCTPVDNCTPADCLESHQCNTVSNCKDGKSCCGSGPDGCTDTKTDSSNCGQCGKVCGGCTTCQDGECKPDDDQCDGNNGEDICCPSGTGFSCQTGPNCGCDVDGDCEGLTDLTQCKVGYCDDSGATAVCSTKPASSSTVCAGIGSICDPTVTCSGTDQSCPGNNYTPSGADCGQCAVCDGAGSCISKCIGTQDCCIDTDICVPDGAQCCSSVANCPAPSCDGLTHITYTCSDGYCHKHTESCGDGLFCTNDTCDAQDGCGHSPIPCTSPPFCFTGPGTCNEDTNTCDYTPVTCDDPPVCFTGTGTCNPENGKCEGYTAKVCNAPPNTLCYEQNGTCDTETGDCVYTKKATGTTCGTCKQCNDAGQCVNSSDLCCGVTCEGACQVCDGESGTCVGCTGSTPICNPSTNTCVQCIAAGDCPASTDPTKCVDCQANVCVTVGVNSCPGDRSCCKGQCTAAGATNSTCPFCVSTSDCCTGCCHYAPSWPGCDREGSQDQQDGKAGHCHEPDNSFQQDYPCACFSDGECSSGAVCCQNPKSPYHKPPITGLGVCVPLSSCNTGTCIADFGQCNNDSSCCSGECDNPSGTPNCGGSNRSGSFCLGQTGASCSDDDCCVSGNCSGGKCVTTFASTAAEDCIPATCDVIGWSCGTTDDGCGGVLDCGTCPDGGTCDEKTHTCTGATCTPKTCADLEAGACGTGIDDGCQGTIDCGCPDGSTCDDTGHCATACVPAACDGITCGAGIDDGCGGTIDCGCADGSVCNGNTCCTPIVCDGVTCGLIDDGCQGVIDCGCADGSVCNGNTCCTPIACDGVTCGLISDGCGGAIQCDCPDGSVCDGSTCCTPTTCDQLDPSNCGLVNDGCGGTINCPCS